MSICISTIKANKKLNDDYQTINVSISRVHTRFTRIKNIRVK